MNRTLLPNPFCSDVVTSAEQSLPVDVPEIHRQPFDVCRSAYETVVREHSSSSVLMHGEAGCGKTHLLSRLRRWLAREIEPFPSLAPGLLVSIRMETAPSQIWRHIRRRVAEELTRKAQGGVSPLDTILRRFAASHGGKLQDALEASEIVDLGLDLSKVIEHFEAGRHRRLCRAWMMGEGLSDADLEHLNLPPARVEEIEEDFAEANARRFVLAMNRLTAPRPVVFFFDQVEALGISQQGSASYALFSRAGAALVDGSNNALAISTILATFLGALEDGSMRSDYQRIGKQTTYLEPLDLAQGRALIDSRLALLAELKGQEPVPETELRAFYEQQHGRCNARKLIHEARRLFAEWQHCAVPTTSSVPVFLQAEFESLWANSEIRTQHEKVDAVLAHGLPVALEMLGRKTTNTDAGLTIDENGSSIQVVFINQFNMRSLAATLKRLIDKKTPLPSLCLVRDQRLLISRSAVATEKRLREIEQGGGRLIRVDVEALAALDAMRKLLTAATSGDLSSNGEAVEAKTVREWLAQNLPAEVEKFTSELLKAEPHRAEDLSSDALLELVGKHKIVPVDEVVRLIGWPREKIEDYAQTHPLHLRWFGGSRPVVCQAVASQTAQDNSHV